jgi:hypothetical protein
MKIAQATQKGDPEHAENRPDSLATTELHRDEPVLGSTSPDVGVH